MFDTIFPLGKEPAIAPAFGKLRPWMNTGEIETARPADWNQRSSRKQGEPIRGGIEWRYTQISEEKYHRITTLSVSLKRGDVRRRLVAAWGPGFTHHDADGVQEDVSCWNAVSSKLRACHIHAAFGDGTTDEIELLALQRLDETLSPSSPVAPEKLASYLGKTRSEIRALFPDVLEDRVLSKTNPALVHPMIGSEYRMMWFPDELELRMTDDKVSTVILGFQSDDNTRAQELRDRVTAAAKRAEGAGHTTSVGGWAEAGGVTIVVSQ